MLLVVLDCSGRIVQFNGACEALTGYKADEVMGKCSSGGHLY
ncbi:MAG: PAS domain S-box protein [Desulfobacterales bacterium]|nr:PAS domain S-box protein [Desulfobacterales bacterium]